MCVLCGEMISSFHWSDISFKEENTTISAGERQKERLQARLKKVVIINNILRFYRLQLKEWQGSKYILSNLKGGSVIVNDLGDLWDKMYELEHISADALDTQLLAFLHNG